MTLTARDATTMLCSIDGGPSSELGIYAGGGIAMTAPLSATAFLFGQELPGGRMHGARDVDYQRVDRCQLAMGNDDVAVGPSGLWASGAGESTHAIEWTLHQGDQRIVSPPLNGRAVVWTR